MKNIFPVIRIIGLVLLAFVLAELTVETGEDLAIVGQPTLWYMLLVVAVLGLAIEISVGALRRVLFLSLSREKKYQYLRAEVVKRQNEFSWIKKKYKKLLGAKPMSKEEEIILDHNYDGIRELDNKLPPWWLYGFYVSIIFAVVYMVRYHVFNDTNQIEEYKMEVAQAEKDIARYKELHKDEVDASNVEMLTDASDIKAGKAIFTSNCVACHKKGGAGGIGPNLTDKYWILGGGIKNVFHTISEGGRSGKGMIAWKASLKPSEIQEVASYVMSLQGTDPADAKEPQGDKWDGDEEE